MGGCDVVMGMEWLHILGLVAMDFKELHVIFNKNGLQYTLKGIQIPPPKSLALIIWKSSIRRVTLELL
jgi:hypothetical protein